MERSVLLLYMGDTFYERLFFLFLQWDYLWGGKDHSFHNISVLKTLTYCLFCRWTHLQLFQDSTLPVFQQVNIKTILKHYSRLVLWIMLTITKCWTFESLWVKHFTYLHNQQTRTEQLTSPLHIDIQYWSKCFMSAKWLHVIRWDIYGALVVSVVRQEVDEEQVYLHHILFALSSPPRSIILTADKIADKSAYVDICWLLRVCVRLIVCTCVCVWDCEVSGNLMHRSVCV